MNNNNTTPNALFCQQRKGAVVVMVAVTLVVLLGCAALAVDIGYLYVARAELQRTADAAALAGAQALARGSGTPFGEYLYLEDIYSQAESYALSNEVLRQGLVLDPHGGHDHRVRALAERADLARPGLPDHEREAGRRAPAPEARARQGDGLLRDILERHDEQDGLPLRVSRLAGPHGDGQAVPHDRL